MIVVVAGAAGSGKDTVADGLVERCGFCKIALADCMKRFCRDLFGFTDEQLWGPSSRRNEVVELPNGSVVVRDVLQKLGTEWGREMCYEHVWVDRLKADVEKLRTGWFTYDQKTGACPVPGSSRLPQPRGFVVPDVRFRNELRMLTDEDGIGIRVRGRSEPLPSELSGHVSEQTEFCDSDFDLIIFNSNLTIEQSVDRAVNFVKHRSTV